MTDFRGALYDGSDPLYAPGISWSGRFAYWKPPAKYLKAGYEITRVRLEPGARDDALAPARAQQCRDLTREMVRWYEGEMQAISPDSWGYLIGRYKSDEYSPFQTVKQNTRDNYNWLLSIWEASIGEVALSDTNYEFIKGLEGAMKSKGRSTSYIRRMFTMMRGVVSYGANIDLPHCERIHNMLSRIRIKTPPKRSIAPTRDQALAVIAEAGRAGDYAFQLGYSLQWWFALRAVDVRGQWLKSTDTSGICRNGQRWQDGLTWDMISEDLKTIRKVISKTEGSDGMVRVYDLSPLPELTDLLSRTPREARIGPVIVSERTGLPYSVYSWSHTFRRHARVAGVPDEVLMMDARAGAITDGQKLGIGKDDLQATAGHADGSTTELYMRGRDQVTDKVVKLRVGK